MPRIEMTEEPDLPELDSPRPSHTLEGVLAGLLLLAAIGTIGWAWWQAHSTDLWLRQLLRTHPIGIILHHTSSPEHAEGQIVDAALIDRWHEHRGWAREWGGRVYHIGYHYVILRDGTIQPGRPEEMWGSHCHGHNDQLGVCLVGDFDSSSNPNGVHGAATPTEAQLRALDGLLHRLIEKYAFTPDDLHRHSDYEDTACPGDRFPFAEVAKRAFEAP
jgi:hypothetical protein